jgi:trans-AT polyketide synthase/acyltransferase/oxidoreductase domain-containing protein
MGASLFEKFPAEVREVDDVLGYSIKTLCLEDPSKNLDDTEYTQPALYVVNALSYLKKRDQGKAPAYAAGHSLGEYDALFAAGAFDLTTGLQLVKKRGQLMGRAKGGGMAAVIGLPEERIRATLLAEGLGALDIANFNSPSQLVISGLRDDVERAVRPLTDAGAKHVAVLRVSAAFHSRYMVDAEAEYRSFLSGFTFAPLAFPVLSNARALAYDADDVRETLATQISSPVRWTEIIRRLLSLDDPEFEEIGPGKVLTGLIRQIKAEATPLVGSFAPEPRQERPALARSPELITATSVTKSAPAPAADVRMPASIARITVGNLGSAAFRRDFGLKYSYYAGAMYRGIASEDLVIAMGRSGFMGFFGAGGLSIDRVRRAIQAIQAALGPDAPYGVNFLHDPTRPDHEEAVAELFMECGVRTIEAAAFMQATPALVLYRARGLVKGTDGATVIGNRVIAKVSRPEVAEAFLTPPPERILEQLLGAHKITAEQADLARGVALADAVTVEADSGGHTDQGVAFALLPAMLSLRDRLAKAREGSRRVYIGAAGGLGTPEAIAAAFVMGADYVVTGSINQCTVESGASSAVKDILQEADVQDTTMAPAGDMFEFGSQVQVLSRGLFFAGRAKKLYELYRQYDSLDAIDAKTRAQIERSYFKRSFEDVWEETKTYFRAIAPEEIVRAESNAKHKMALVFRWYFGHSFRLAADGKAEGRVDYQIHCGPALGSFNAYVRGTDLQPWTNRRVAHIAQKLMTDAAVVLEERFAAFARSA